ncbi:MAG TPA: histidine kinase dimerization/phospho-acceptor domain-containing protein, partial [Sphingobacteriaceae bacterium]
MKQLAAFFNWPLGELLKSETDNLNKASIRILFTILTLTLIKAVIGIAVAVEYNQDVQLYRAVVLLLVYSALLTSFLARKISFKTIAHALLGLGLLVIWTNIFVFAGTINIPVLQFNFMLILGSFYLLGKRSGIIYAILGTLPAIVRIIADRGAWLPEILSEELASPGFELIVVLNFATILLCHYQFLAAFRANIAEKEALNKQLQRAAEEANRAAEAKSEFLSTMTHELRTPLNSVIGVSQLLLQNSNADDQESLQILKFSAVNLYSLINNILDFNKLGSDKLGLEKIPVDLDALMNETCLGVRFQAERKGIGFQLDIDERIKGMWVLTDPTRITQII